MHTPSSSEFQHLVRPVDGARNHPANGLSQHDPNPTPWSNYANPIAGMGVAGTGRPEGSTTVPVTATSKAAAIPGSSGRATAAGLTAPTRTTRTAALGGCSAFTRKTTSTPRGPARPGGRARSSTRTTIRPIRTAPPRKGLSPRVSPRAVPAARRLD